MKFLDVLDNIILAIVSISGIYGIADHENEMHDLEEDKYLPKKKINELNIFHSLRTPARFKSYWMQNVAQFFFFTYFSGLIIGRLITHSFTFVYSTFFGYYPFVMYSFPLFAELGFFIYVRFKKYKDKK